MTEWAWLNGQLVPSDYNFGPGVGVQPNPVFYGKPLNSAPSATADPSPDLALQLIGAGSSIYDPAFRQAWYGETPAATSSSSLLGGVSPLLLVGAIALFLWRR